MLKGQTLRQKKEANATTHKGGPQQQHQTSNEERAALQLTHSRPGLCCAQTSQSKNRRHGRTDVLHCAAFSGRCLDQGRETNEPRRTNYEVFKHFRSNKPTRREKRSPLFRIASHEPPNQATDSGAPSAAATAKLAPRHTYPRTDDFEPRSSHSWLIIPSKGLNLAPSASYQQK